MQRSPNHEPLTVKAYSLPVRQVKAIQKIAEKRYAERGRPNASMAMEEVIEIGLSRPIVTTS